MTNKQIDISDYRELGKTGIKVSPFAIGGWEFGGPPNYPDQDDRESVKIIRKAIEMGVNFFDTAEMYGNGHSEEIIGEAVRQSGENIVISTKIATNNFRGTNSGPDFKITADSVREAIEGSLKRLNRDYIDIYFLHWPSSDVLMDEVINMMMKLKDQGKLRAFGVSNFLADQLETARKYGEIDVLQSPYSLLWRCLEDDVFAYCSKTGISLNVYSPLANGLLTNAFKNNDRKPLSDTQNMLVLFREPYFNAVTPVLNAVEDIAGKYDCTISQVAIAWMLSKQNVTAMILGVEKLPQLIENIDSLRIKLSPSDITKLEEAGEPLKNLTMEMSKRSMTGWWPDKEKTDS